MHVSLLCKHVPTIYPSSVPLNKFMNLYNFVVFFLNDLMWPLAWFFETLLSKMYAVTVWGSTISNLIVPAVITPAIQDGGCFAGTHVCWQACMLVLLTLTPVHAGITCEVVMKDSHVSFTYMHVSCSCSTTM